MTEGPRGITSRGPSLARAGSRRGIAARDRRSEVDAARSTQRGRRSGVGSKDTRPASGNFSRSARDLFPLAGRAWISVREHAGARCWTSPAACQGTRQARARGKPGQPDDQADGGDLASAGFLSPDRVSAHRDLRGHHRATARKSPRDWSRPPWVETFPHQSGKSFHQSMIPGMAPPLPARRIRALQETR